MGPLLGAKATDKLGNKILGDKAPRIGNESQDRMDEPDVRGRNPSGKKRARSTVMNYDQKAG